LRRRFDSAGSMEYSLTWRESTTPAGRPFCLLRASGRRTSGTGFGGWPTPKAGEDKSSNVNLRGNLTLKGAARLAGWGTPTQRDHKDGDCLEANVEVNALLGRQCQLAGWKTPMVCTPNSLRGTGQDPEKRKAQGHTVNLQDQVHLVSGATSISSGAGTEKRGALNPAHSRWLMGFPPAWDACGVTAMPSCRKSRRSS